MSNEQLRRWEVWSQGWAATGGYSNAQFHGEVEADTFADACRIALSGRSDFDPHGLTLWGCRLFDNEADARKVFG